MRNKTFFLLIPIAALCFIAAKANVQGSEAEQGLRVNDLVIYFSIFSKGPAAGDGVSRIYNIEENTIERTLINESTGMYVGYALRVERLENSSKLKIFVNPQPPDAIERMRDSVWFKKLVQTRPDKRNDGPTPLIRYPEPRTIDVSDVVELALWINPETGAQIGDRLRFELDQPLPPHDFTLDDVPLRLTNYRLFINGELRSGDKMLSGGFIAPLPWFSIPGRGRFIFSIQPHEGYDFQKIGLIDDNRISFTHGGDKYEWVGSQPIIHHRGKWNLWVLYDPAFEPTRKAQNDASLLSKGNCCVYGGLSKADQIARARP